METKARVLYLLRILEQYSDEDHPLSTTELIKMLLEQYGISSHRTTIKADVEVLQAYGVDIDVINSTQNKYYIAGRTFELPELKLLIDAVESSINSGKKISFLYFEYNVKKEKKLKNAGNPYVFSPYALIWSGDFYYVVGYSEKHNGIGGFRVDRIAKSPTILEDDIIPKPADFNIADYAKSVFQMYGCEECEVTLRCDNRIMKYIIERFGEDVTTAAYDMTSFRAFVNVELSPTFYGWVFGFGGKVQILSPDKAKNQYAEMLKSAMETQA